MKSEVWREIGARVEMACWVSGKSMAALAREIGVSDQALLQWRKGESFPTPKNWEALEKATGVPQKAIITQPGGIRDIMNAYRKELERHKKGGK